MWPAFRAAVMKSRPLWPVSAVLEVSIYGEGGSDLPVAPMTRMCFDAIVIFF